MIQNISIENFRCFDKTEIKGFSRINVITGKNNSGKTCLLEALYFGLSQDTKGTIDTRSYEGIENTGFSLMKNQDLGTINFKFTVNNEEFGFKYQPEFSFKDDKTGENFTHHNDVQLILDKNKKYPQLSTLNLNEPKKTNEKNSSSINLVQLFDQAQITGLDKEILDSVKIIDSTITEIRTFGSYPNTLFLKKEGTIFQPINYHGDAVGKVILYISIMLNYKKSLYNYLLIDEIENGIHYTAQKEVWQMLFKLCKHHNIQLFATTHSHEMITAFEEVCEEFEGEGAYFEMARHAKTNQIIGIKHDITTLEYELATNTPIRGE